MHRLSRMMLILGQFGIILSLVFSFLPSCSQPAQVVGDITDSKGNGLPFASAFLNKTTLGDVADEKGAFSISNVPEGVYELVGSSVGYSTYKKALKLESGQTYRINITLSPVETVLKEVRVTTGKDKAWQKNLELFKKAFIGTTSESRECKIANPWVINFEADAKKSRKSLIASTSSPLEIENRALGYKLTYFLQRFSADFEQGTVSSYNFQGTIRFEEIVSPDSLIKRKWQARRMNAYLGSYRHLFKSIIDGQAKSEGYEILVPKTKLGDPFDFRKTSALEFSNVDLNTIRAVLNAPGLYKIAFDRWEVHYARKPENPDDFITHESSVIVAKSGYVIVDSRGILYNANDVILSGQMFEQRVSMHLPYDFEPNPESSSGIRIR